MVRIRKMGTIALILTIVLVLGSTAPAFAEPSVKVSGSSISFAEDVTDDMITHASKQFEEKKGDIAKATLNLQSVTDDMVAKACAAYPGVQNIVLLNAPELTSVEPVAGLADITGLTFQDLPKVTDLSPLSKNTKLTRVEISKVGFANPDMTWIAPLTGLSELTVENAPASLTSLEGMESLVKLRQFTLKRSTAPDLTPLCALPNLQKLNLAYSFADLTPLKGCAKLTELSLYGSTATDIAPLAEVPSLKTLDVYATKNIADYDAIGAIKTLESVSTGLSAMTTVAWAAELPNLKRAAFFKDAIADLTPLGKATSLEYLSLWQLEVPDTAFLAPLKNLKELKMDGSNEKSKTPLDLSALKDLAALKTLVVSNSPVSNPGSLSSLAALQYLDIRKTEGISDLRPLIGLTNLKAVQVSPNTFSEADTKVLTEKGIKVEAR